MRHFLKLGLLLILLTGVLAPPGARGQRQERLAGPLPAQEVEVSPDVKMVTSAIALRLRGLELVEGVEHKVVFEPEAAESLKAPDFNYGGFRLLRIEVSGFESFPEDPNMAEIEGILHFQDRLGRRTFVAYGARYGLEGGDIHVTRARAATVFPPVPQVRLFFVPAEKLTKEAFKAFNANLDALAFVVANAVPLDMPGKIPDGSGDYYVVAFFMDRLAPGAEVGLETGNSLDGPFRRTPHTLVFDHAGWRVVMIRGRFAFNGEDEVFFRATYRPANRGLAADQEPVVAGVFSTHVGANP